MHKSCYGCRYRYDRGSYEEPCVSCTYEDGKRNWTAEPGEEDFNLTESEE